MTLDECYAKYQGTAVSADGITANKGQCPQWSNIVLNQVYGLPYHYGNAINWWDNPGELLNNFDKITDSSIKAGDFIVYDARVGSVFGHIDVAAQDGNANDFVAYDSNWDAKHFHDSNGYPVLHEVHHNDIYNTYILGALRRKVVEPMLNAGDVTNIYVALLGRQPDDAGAAYWLDKPFKDLIYDILDSPEYKARVAARTLSPGTYLVN